MEMTGRQAGGYGGLARKKRFMALQENPESVVRSEKTADRILQLIRDEKLQPGDKLPPERDLAARLKISRPRLREALNALKLMNIIVNRQGSGTYVASLKAEKLVVLLDSEFALNDTTYADLLEARRILETGIAALAAEHITAGELGEMEACITKAAATLHDAEAFMETDIELHNRILKASRNEIIPVFMRAINRLGIYSRRRTGEQLAIRQQSLKDHRRIVQALQAKDPEASRKAMLDHLAHVARRLPKS